MDNDLISADDAAKILGVSRGTIYNMIHRGVFHLHQIPGVKRTKLYRDEVESLVPKPPSHADSSKALKRK
jgi:excisionase family DNA binding protein